MGKGRGKGDPSARTTRRDEVMAPRAAELV